MIAPVVALGDGAARYEQLRRAALGDAVEPAWRAGLTLLLRRGLWAWARALAAAPVEPPRLPAGSLLPPDRRPHLARLLAGMALAHTPTTSPPP
ncbi:MAG: hypothetical protein FJ102_09580 [Deltaproteobacteria bacterium]|nr:hypothetical protein [Deltaproteobacteria bacterium]